MNGPMNFEIDGGKKLSGRSRGTLPSMGDWQDFRPDTLPQWGCITTESIICQAIAGMPVAGEVALVKTHSQVNADIASKTAGPSMGRSCGRRTIP